MRFRHIFVGLILLAALAGGAVVYHATTIAAADVRTIAAGTAPWAAAMGAAGGRAFILNRSPAWNRNSVASRTGSVTVLDTRHGAILATAAVGPDPRAVAIDDALGRVYVVNDDDASVSVLDAGSGAYRGTIAVGAQPRALALDAGTQRGFVVNTGDSTVSVLDLQRGVVLRTIHVNAAMFRASAAVDERRDRVYIGGPGVITVLDGHSGAVLRTLAVPRDANQMAVDTGTGQIYMTGDGTLSVLDGATGRTHRVLAVGDAVGAVAVDTRRERVFVAQQGALDSTGMPTGAGSVTILDARTGAVLRTVGVGVAPVAVSVDERSGRAMVVNAGGTVPAADPLSWLPGWLRQHVPWLTVPGDRTIPGSVSLIENKK